MIRTAAFAAVATIAISFAAAAQSFRGYPCTADCSGHEAGYEWAEQNDISDASDCNGNSNSFNEGCEAYVEESGENESAIDASVVDGE